MSGALLMVLASGLFATMFAMVKALGPAFPFAEGVFFRGLFGLPMVLVLMRRAGVDARPRRPYLLLLRGLLGLGGMSAYFYATQHGTLADVWLVGRFQPVLVAVMAPFLLGERAPRSVLGVLAVSLTGVVVVIRPGMDLLNTEIEFLAGVTDAATEAEYDLLISTKFADKPVDEAIERILYSQLSDGIIHMSPGANDAVIGAYQRYRKPVVI